MSDETIWKFQIPIADKSSISMPSVAQPLAVELSPDGLAIDMWAWVKADSPIMPRLFYVRGTGHPMGAATPSRHVGTVQDGRRGLVWHVFDGGVVS